MTTEQDPKRLRHRDELRRAELGAKRPRKKIGDRKRRLEEIERKEVLNEVRNGEWT